MKAFFVGLGMAVQSFFGAAVDGTYYVTSVAADLFMQQPAPALTKTPVETAIEEHGAHTTVSAAVLPPVIYTELPYTLLWDIDAEFISVIIHLDGQLHQTIPCENRQTTAFGEACDITLTKQDSDPHTGYKSYFVAHTKDAEIARFSLGHFELHDKSELALQTYRHPEAHFSLSYPTTWSLHPGDDTLRFAGPKSDAHTSLYVSHCHKSDCPNMRPTTTVATYDGSLFRTETKEVADHYVHLSYGVYDQAGERSQPIVRMIAASLSEI